MSVKLFVLYGVNKLFGLKLSLNELMERGVKIVLCSGRDYASLKRELKILGLDHEGQYGVGLNGGSIFRADTGENLYTERMGAEEAKTMIKASRKYPDMVSIHVFGPDHCYVEVTNETTYFYELVTGSKLTVIDDLTTIAEEAIKVGVFLRSEKKTVQDLEQDNVDYCKQEWFKIILLPVSISWEEILWHLYWVSYPESSVVI